MKGKYLKKKKDDPVANIAENIGGVASLVYELKDLQKDVIETVDHNLEKVDSALEEVRQAITDIKLIAKGEPGDDADEEKIATWVLHEVLNNLPVVKDGRDADEEEVIKKVLAQIPKQAPVDEGKLIKKVMAALPDRKADLKIIQEQLDPELFIDKLFEHPKFKKHSTGLEQTMSAFRNQLSRGYIHGGGDTVVAGVNVTITTDSQGRKIINSTGVGDFVGPSSSTDKAIVRFNGTTGKLGQNSVITISDTGIISTPLLTSAIVFGVGGSFTTQFNFNTPTSNRTFTFPDSSGTIVTTTGTATLTNKTLTSPVINVTSDATGDIYYRSAGGLFTRLPIGNTNDVLTVTAGLPSWSPFSSSGTVTTVSVATVNGFAGSVANATTTPAITLTTTITGILKGNGTAISAAVAGTDYVIPGINNNLTALTGLTGGINSPTFVTFTGQASPVYSQGKLLYDTDNESLTFFNNDSNVALQIGQEDWIRVVNNTGSTIANGSAVYISGASAGLPTIALAQSNAAATTIVAGLATESIANGATGYVTCIGLVRGFDTSAFVAGSTVFLSSATPGALTNTAPTAPNYRYRVGIVGTSNAVTGTIHVTPSTAALGNGTANQLFGINNAGTAQEVKTLTGAGGVDSTNTTNTITLTKVDKEIKAYQALGSVLVAETVGTTLTDISSTLTLTDGQARFVAIYLEKGQTITGVKWWQSTTGSYTADQNNYVALYTYSGGNLTQVAISANNGNIWQTTGGGNMGSAAFTSSYVASAGIYYVGLLYNNSAQVTAPILGAAPTNGSNVVAGDFTNSAKIHGAISAQNTLVTSQAMSGLSTQTARIWLGVY